MALTTLDQIRQEGNLPSDVDDSRLQPHLDGAVTRMKSILGEDLYDSVEGENDTTRRAELSRAEAMIALYYAIPVLNIRANPDGGLVRSTGFGESRTEVLSFAEADALAKHFYEKAMQIVAAYLPEPEETADGEVTSDSIIAGNLDWVAV